MVTRYLPPVNLGSSEWFRDRVAEEAIMEGPTFVRTSRGGRWHMIRAGKRWIMEGSDDRLRETYELWCGMSAGDYQGLMMRDVVPMGEPICGKCHGAALGADPDVPEFIFLPRGLRRPKVCPSSQTMWFRQDPEHWNRGWCLACGEYVKLRGFGGWYNSQWGVQRHEPGPGLVGPCPLHGWKQMIYTETGSGCRCGERSIEL
jgi:hypothetical protein